MRVFAGLHRNRRMRTRAGRSKSPSFVARGGGGRVWDAAVEARAAVGLELRILMAPLCLWLAKTIVAGGDHVLTDLLLSNFDVPVHCPRCCCPKAA